MSRAASCGVKSATQYDFKTRRRLKVRPAENAFAVSCNTRLFSKNGEIKKGVKKDKGHPKEASLFSI